MVSVNLKGKPCRLGGKPPNEGDVLPDFLLVNTALRDRTLSDYQGRPTLISTVPSIDTSVCAASAKRLDAMAESFPGIDMLLVSADLPFAQKRFIEEAQLSRLVFLSQMRTDAFARDYGVLLEEGPLAGLAARAVFITDDKTRLVYKQIVKEVTDEPDYDAILEVLKQITQEHRP